MNPLLSCSLLATALVLASPLLRAQAGPDITNVIQGVTDRQVERAQNQAVERAVQQAEAAQNRASERAEARQSDNVQSQVVEQVESRVERAQSQAAERAQSEVERVQSQVERAQELVDQVQTQAEDRIGRLPELPEQAAERARANVPDRIEAVPAPRPAGESGNNIPAPGTRGVAAATADDVGDDTAAAPPIPDRRNVVDNDGNAAFVEITLESGVRAIEYEWVMLVTPAERQLLDMQAADLMAFLSETDGFGLNGGQLLTFSVPPDLDANDAILQLVPPALRELIDRNHVYVEQADTGSVPAPSLLSLPMPAACTVPLSIGIIDSALDTNHAAFSQLKEGRLQTRSFVDTTLVQPAAHGTAVASVLVGSESSKADTALRPLLPNATLYSAAVFHAAEGNGQGATAQRVLRALDWLAGVNDVKVINMSLAGPPNRLLAQAIALAQQQGKVIVAAVGNEGPYGPVRYPAAYDEVVGVTAVARDGSVFRFANQGPQVDFAALGVAVPVALGDGGFGPESGTSVAAPVVAAMIACAMQQQGAEAAAALARLQHAATDLGAPGTDSVYGKGLLHP